MIKSAIVDQVISASVLDTFSQDDEAVLKKKARLLKANLIPRHVQDAKTEERVEALMQGVRGHEDPLRYALYKFDQDFLNDDAVPYDMRREICKALVVAFEQRGNPIWQRFVDGTFRYIEVEKLND